MKTSIIKFHFAQLIVLILTIIISSCGSKSSGEEGHGEGEEEEHHEEGGSVVKINTSQYAQLDIQLGNIEDRNLAASLKSTGNLKVPPQNKAAVTAIMGGTVQSILVREGDRVQKGEILVTLSNSEFIKLQQEYLNAQAQLGFAEPEYVRQKELAENNAAALKTFQQAEANYNSLKANLSALKQQLNLLGMNPSQLTAENLSSVISVRSPVSGNVAHIDISIGSTVDPSEEMMSVVDNSELHLDLFVFEQDLRKVEVGQSVDVMLTNLPGKHYDAKIFSIGTAFEGESKSITVHAAITGDKSGLIEGMSVIASINTGNSSVPAVAASAIVSTGGLDYIFIETVAEEHGHKEAEEHTEGEEHQHEEGEQHEEDEKESHDEAVAFTFQRVQIKKGISDGGFTEITPMEEIPADAKVVVNGAFYLMAMLTNAGEEAHGH